MLLNTRGRNRGSRPKHFLRPPVVRMVYEVLLTDKSIFHCFCQNIDQKLRDWLIGNQSVAIWKLAAILNRRNHTQQKKIWRCGSSEFFITRMSSWFFTQCGSAKRSQKEESPSLSCFCASMIHRFLWRRRREKRDSSRLSDDEKMFWSMWLSIGHDDRERERHKKQCLLDF
jgi:hypothetical protein